MLFLILCFNLFVRGYKILYNVLLKLSLVINFDIFLMIMRKNLLLIIFEVGLILLLCFLR